MLFNFNLHEPFITLLQYLSYDELYMHQMSSTQTRHLLAHETDRSNSSTTIFRNKDTKIYSLDNIWLHTHIVG